MLGPVKVDIPLLRNCLGEAKKQFIKVVQNVPKISGSGKNEWILKYSDYSSKAQPAG